MVSSLALYEKHLTQNFMLFSDPICLKILSVTYLCERVLVDTCSAVSISSGSSI